jgi:hypothetical protein
VHAFSEEADAAAPEPGYRFPASAERTATTSAKVAV